ncbi:MAG: long-chain fatty acid--CoA ligase [Bacteroidales bacterium]|nr:long-chain fatty acid--CoA ligase [Bacteroidales bacterium]MCI2145010.1 long-chain fatty acid--CoA ligase [Bacteroidales bacterium]
MLAIRCKGQWVKYSIDDYDRISNSVARGLLASGFKAGTKIISITPNRPEWNFLDMGTALAHMIYIPVYPTLSNDDCRFIFNHSDCEAIFIGSENIYNRVLPVIKEMDHPVRIYMLDDCDDKPCMRDIIALGDREKEKWEPVIEDNKKNIGENDWVTMIYTSGTTGTPKGVMLSHRNLLFDSLGHAEKNCRGWEHKAFSFLPLCHIYERTMNYDYQELGVSLYYGEGLTTLASDMQSCHPDMFCAVPRVLELVYRKFNDAGRKLKGVKHLIYAKAWRFANSYDNQNKSKYYQRKRNLYDKLVYRQWRAQFGGHEIIVVSGGSSIRENIVRTFNAAKLNIFEGYGMTESSPVIAVNSPMEGINVFGTNGKVMYGTEVKFLQDDGTFSKYGPGEILSKGPHIMLGYYKNPEATAEAVDKDGFLHTGDIGYLKDGLYLKITDRKKEIFKLTIGKYVAPQVIETKLNESPFISSSFVFGSEHKFASAIIVPNFDEVKRWCAVKGIIYTNDKEMTGNQNVINKIHSEVAKVNETLAPHECIRKERLSADEWTSADDLLSQTLKLKRKKLDEKYRTIIDEIYQNE